MIELLGIGVRSGEVWRFRRVCARFEARTVAAVLSDQAAERRTLLDVIAGRVVPSEGRAWIDGTPLRADTAARIRQRVAVVDLGRPAPSSAPRRALASTLERIGLGAAWDPPPARLDLPDRARGAVNRALRSNPNHIVIHEPDAALAPDDTLRLLQFLHDLVVRERLSVFLSLADPRLAREVAVTLRLAAGEAIPA